MVFVYGPIRVLISFEHQDEYVLDLMHFGSTSGIFNPQELSEKARTLMENSLICFNGTFNWIEDRAEKLKEWLAGAIEEFPILFGPVITPSLTKMMAFFDKLIEEIKHRKDAIHEEVFGIDRHSNLMIIEEETITTKGVGHKIVSEMQANRIHMLLGKRVCELLFLLRKSHHMLINKFLPKIFGKRSPFVIYLEQNLK